METSSISSNVFSRPASWKTGLCFPRLWGRGKGGVLSPLLANIALNFLDWKLHKAKLRFVRYADDFVILCWSKRRAEEARKLVESGLTELGLKLSHEKTKVTTFCEG